MRPYPIFALLLPYLALSSAVAEPDFEAFFMAKGHSQADRDSVKRSFERREALVSAIESEASLNTDLIYAEVNELRKDLLIDAYFAKFADESVKDKDIEDYYRSNIKEFESVKVKLSHIFFSDASKKGKGALKLATEAHAKLLAGSPFESVAQEYSEDTMSAHKGGELGWVGHGFVDNNFSEVVFSMKQGNLSRPIKSSAGVHIVKFLDGPVTQTMPLDSVREKIRERLASVAKEKELKRLMSRSNP